MFLGSVCWFKYTLTQYIAENNLGIGDTVLLSGYGLGYGAGARTHTANCHPDWLSNWEGCVHRTHTHMLLVNLYRPVPSGFAFIRSFILNFIRPTTLPSCVFEFFPLLIIIGQAYQISDPIFTAAQMNRVNLRLSTIVCLFISAEILPAQAATKWEKKEFDAYEIFSEALGQVEGEPSSGLVITKPGESSLGNLTCDWANFPCDVALHRIFYTFWGPSRVYRVQMWPRTLG